MLEFLFHRLFRFPNNDKGLEAFYYSENMPSELAESDNIASEKRLVSEKHTIYGDVDQIFKKKNGRLVVVDTKRREKRTVYFSDVVQISLYSLMLKLDYNFPIEPYGYVRLVVNKKVLYVRIQLLSREKLEFIIERYRMLDRGESAPQNFNYAKYLSGWEC